MKILSFLALILLSFGAVADNYKLQLTRKGQDMYHIDNMSAMNNDWYLVTQFCYEYVYSEIDLVTYVPYGFNNKIFFQNGNTCQFNAIQNIITYK